MKGRCVGEDFCAGFKVQPGKICQVVRGSEPQHVSGQRPLVCLPLSYVVQICILAGVVDMLPDRFCELRLECIPS